MNEQGLRYNEGKERTDLLPPFAINQLAKVLTLGAKKYAERNWELGMKWSNVISSLKRHISRIEEGEDYDKESGMLHASHVMCNAAFLTEYYKIYPQGDDRPHRYLKMPKIGLDIDDVLADYVPYFSDVFDLPIPVSWDWSYSFEGKFAELFQDIDKAKQFYLNIPVKTKPEDIPFEPYCYITSRSVPIEWTKMWIEVNRFPCKKLYSLSNNASKVETAKEAGIDIFVDDKFENFVELNNAGICCYLFDAPWNNKYDVGHKRIKNLMDLKMLV